MATSATGTAVVIPKVLWALVSNMREDVGNNWIEMQTVPVDGPDALIREILQQARTYGLQDVRNAGFLVRKEEEDSWRVLSDSMPVARFLDLVSPSSDLRVKHWEKGPRPTQLRSVVRSVLQWYELRERMPVDSPQALVSAILDGGAARQGALDAEFWVRNQEGTGWLTLNDSMTQAELLELWLASSTLHVKAVIPAAMGLGSRSYAAVWSDFQQSNIVRAVASVCDHDECSEPFAKFWEEHQKAVQAVSNVCISHITNETREGALVYRQIANLIERVMENICQAAYPGLQLSPPGGISHRNRAGTRGIRPDIAWCGFTPEARNSQQLHVHVQLLIEYIDSLQDNTSCNQGLGQLVAGWKIAANERRVHTLRLPCALVDSQHVVGVVLERRARGEMMRTQTPLRYAGDEEHGEHLVDPTSPGASGCAILPEHEPILVRSATGTYTLRIVAQLTKLHALGATYAVDVVASTQVGLASPTGRCLLKVGAKPCDLMAAQRLHLNLDPWTQVEREVAVLRHLGRHALQSVPEVIDDGVLEAPACAPDMAGARAVITPLHGRALVQQGAVRLPILGPAAVQTLAEDLMEGLAFLHSRAMTPARATDIICSIWELRVALQLADQPLGHALYTSDEWLLTGRVSSSFADIESLLYTCMAVSSPAPLPWEEAVQSGDIPSACVHRASLYLHPEENAVVQSWPRSLRNVALGIFGCMAAGTVPPPTDQWLHMLRGDPQERSKRVRADGAEADNTCAAPAGDITPQDEEIVTLRRMQLRTMMC
eukprot:jgi/Chlat1/1467/Chrsp12S02071